MGKPIEKQPVQGKASAKVERPGPTVANAEKQKKSQDAKVSGQLGGKIEASKSVEKGARRQEVLKTRKQVENSGNDLKYTTEQGMQGINKIVEKNANIDQNKNVDFKYRKQVLTKLTQSGQISVEEMNKLKTTDPIGYRAVKGLIKANDEIKLTDQQLATQNAYNEAYLKTASEGGQLALMGPLAYTLAKGIQYGGKYGGKKLLDQAKVEEDKNLINPSIANTPEKIILAKVNQQGLNSLSEEDKKYINSLPEEKKNIFNGSINSLNKSKIEVDYLRSQQQTSLSSAEAGVDALTETTGLLVGNTSKGAINKVEKNAINKTEQKVVKTTEQKVAQNIEKNTVGKVEKTVITPKKVSDEGYIDVKKWQEQYQKIQNNINKPKPKDDYIDISKWQEEYKQIQLKTNKTIKPVETNPVVSFPPNSPGINNKLLDVEEKVGEEIISGGSTKNTINAFDRLSKKPFIDNGYFTKK